MFSNISWQGYWTTLALFCAAYYLVVYWRYFRRDPKISWNRKPVAENLALFPTAKNNNHALRKASVNQQPSLFDDLMDQKEASDEVLLDACLDELKAFFWQAHSTTCNKENVICSLQQILHKHPLVNTKEYRTLITSEVFSWCEQMCSIHLSAGDLKQVWEG